MAARAPAPSPSAARAAAAAFAQAHPGTQARLGRGVGPLQQRRITAACGRRRDALERGGAIEHGADRHRGRQRIGRQGDHGPVPAARPGAFEKLEAHGHVLLGTRVQHDLAQLQVVADDQRIVPDRIDRQPQVLQHDDRVPRVDLAQQIGQ